MTDIFMTVLNMSVTAAFVIAVLCVARLVMRKMRTPKWISYALWAVVGFRLLCPVTIESVLSLVPQQFPTLSGEMIYGIGAPAIEIPISYREPENSINTAPALASVGIPVGVILSYVWISGIVIMAAYAVT